jgi:hypothetical protein
MVREASLRIKKLANYWCNRRLTKFCMKSTIYSDVRPLVWQIFTNVSEENTSRFLCLLSDPEDVGIIFLRNTSELPDYMKLHPRR